MEVFQKLRYRNKEERSILHVEGSGRNSGRLHNHSATGRPQANGAQDWKGTWGHLVSMCSVGVRALYRSLSHWCNMIYLPTPSFVRVHVCLVPPPP